MYSQSRVGEIQGFFSWGVPPAIRLPEQILFKAVH